MFGTAYSKTFGWRVTTVISLRMRLPTSIRSNGSRWCIGQGPNRQSNGCDRYGEWREAASCKTSSRLFGSVQLPESLLDNDLPRRRLRSHRRRFLRPELPPLLLRRGAPGSSSHHSRTWVSSRRFLLAQNASPISCWQFVEVWGHADTPAPLPPLPRATLLFGTVEAWPPVFPPRAMTTSSPCSAAIISSAS